MVTLSAAGQAFEHLGALGKEHNYQEIIDAYLSRRQPAAGQREDGRGPRASRSARQLCSKGEEEVTSVPIPLIPEEISPELALRAMLAVDFPAFIVFTFGVLRPGTPFRPNWHIDAIGP
jgi:hypothetical protein